MCLGGSLKDKKCTTTVNFSRSTLNESKRNPNKIVLDKGHKFYNKSIK